VYYSALQVSCFEDFVLPAEGVGSAPPHSFTLQINRPQLDITATRFAQNLGGMGWAILSAMIFEQFE
jgi:hypothetical protein